MKKSPVLIPIFIFATQFAYFLQEKNMPDLVDIEPISTDSIRILDSIQMVMAVADSINMVLREKVVSQIGRYNITCRLRTTDLASDSIHDYIEVPIDSLFMDTLILSLGQDSLAYLNGNIYGKFTKSTVFTYSKFVTYNYFNRFSLYLLDDKVKYKDTEDPYACKCVSQMRIDNDSIYYHYSSGWNGYDLSVECTGVKIN